MGDKFRNVETWFAISFSKVIAVLSVTICEVLVICFVLHSNCHCLKLELHSEIIYVLVEKTGPLLHFK